MEKTDLLENINKALELFPLDAIKKAPIAKGKTEKIKNLKKEYYSIDNIEELIKE